MRKSLKLLSRAFCSTPKVNDVYFTFDNSSFVTLCARISSFDNFKEKDLEDMQKLGIRRVIYSLKDEQEVMKFLSERYDKTISHLFTPGWLLKGLQYDLPAVLDEKELIKKLSFKALLQVSQHMQSLRPKQPKESFQIFTALKSLTGVKAGEHLTKVLDENFEGVQNIIENSFNYKMNFTYRHCNFADLDYQIDLMGKHQTYNKSFDLEVYRYAKGDIPDHDINQQILSTLYQNGQAHYNTIFMRNHKLDPETKELVNSRNLREGVLQYQHLFDMLKLLNFKGSLVINYDMTYFKENVAYVKELLSQHKFNEMERSVVTDIDEKQESSESQTETLIDI